ncbi:MAG: S-layer homology domain-containing protein [Peptococcaceae bacterium]|nr:S-layer homology domain-containing protein [Peptococcaceae bacterium]
MLRKTSKRFLSIVLAAAMLLSMMPFAAFAADGSENTGANDTTVEETPAATELPPADENGVITLTEDVTLADTISIENNTIIDLNGHTLSSSKTEGVFIDIKSGGALTIRDSIGTGLVRVTETNETPLRCVQVQANATFTLEGGTIENTNTAFEATQVISNYGTVNIKDGTVKGVTCIFMFNPSRRNADWANAQAVCNVSGGNIEGIPATTYNGQETTSGQNVKDLNWCYGITIYGPGVAADGNVDNSKAILNINGGKISAGQGIGTNASSGRYAGYTINMTGGTIDGTTKGTGMYLPAIGVTNISGGVITGAQGIRICAGDLNVTGGTIEGTALSDGTDLISGGSGGTNGAIVVGKASNGYVGDINVNISDSAQIINNTEKENPDDIAPAIVVSDKNMADSTSQKIINPDGGESSQTFTYADTVINMNINSTINGDVVKISNLSSDNTQDGGNTNLDITDATINGNIVNQSVTSVNIENTTVTENIKNSSSGSILLNQSTVKGTVSNNEEGQTAIIGSNVGNTEGSTTIIDSKVNGVPVEDTTSDNVEAYVNATPYATLKEAVNAANNGDVVRLVKDITVTTPSVEDGSGAITITKDIVLDGNDKTITAGTGFTGVKGRHVINIVNPARNVTIQNLTINGQSGENAAARSGINIYTDTTDTTDKTKVTLNNVTAKNCSTYGVTACGKSVDLVLNGLTTSGNGWGGVNIDSRLGAVDLTVNDANINDASSIVFDTKEGMSAPTATINGGNFEFIVFNDGAEDSKLTVNGGTFATGEGPAGTVNIGDYLGEDVVYDPSTGQVSDYVEPPYTGKYSYEIFTKVGDNGTLDVEQYATEGDEVTFTVTPGEAYMLDEMTITSNGKDVDVTDNGDGTYTFTMPSGDVKINVTFTEDPDWEPTPDMPFTDVNENDWFYDVVLYAYENGLMTGTSADTFEPNTATTRGMIVSMLARLEGVNSAPDAGFSDVNASDWYATAVNWAASAGVVNGFEDNTFRANDPITREQMAAILYNYADYKGMDTSARADLSGYSDADAISSWATEVLAWANAEGYVNGMTATTLDPQGSATRAQVAAIFERFLEA